jgi:nucleoside triphosphate pyrophosphatase
VPVRSLVLASASPARLGLLRAAGFAPEVMVSGVDEDGVDGLEAAEIAAVLARRKAVAVVDRLAAHAASPVDAIGPLDRPLVLGCDSVLAVAGEARGKPASPAEATAWWRGYRGTTGTLVTGHVVVDATTGDEAAATAQTRVRFGAPSDAEIAAYVATGEPLRVAGAFTLDGYGAPFVEGIDGDYGTVLGLSLPLMRILLAELGVAVTDLWTAV